MLEWIRENGPFRTYMDVWLNYGPAFNSPILPASFELLICLGYVIHTDYRDFRAADAVQEYATF
jgi:hypothetical protein